VLHKTFKQPKKGNVCSKKTVLFLRPSISRGYTDVELLEFLNTNAIEMHILVFNSVEADRTRRPKGS
jgi:hypothetical protein